eukprot:CAMPEP_0113556536 /NCGR_PEP_ID=MMETSP0015_2-20120614/17306_1 /TAXON_ID=2838 /ORGANISM="Odontella" /LENGTH=65 /DNA_ID=CAMNT_0000457893 /DNA_START=648 /DNA_END=845 /DNA_ORIENTATION=- /assembly_acc=CAM_ASM_000160
MHSTRPPYCPRHAEQNRRIPHQDPPSSTSPTLLERPRPMILASLTVTREEGERVTLLTLLHHDAE